ncbi:hypothetical protein HHK36_022350 [Tetracentron sinense]|uniref:Uncharacterized protein n=1 Tax=Tetracentron sinense TaxID=13715 RepID=A0A834YRS9_TETSI|nr:hypothetical protein HHK36_022350 [Tetracentron sinense]
MKAKQPSLGGFGQRSIPSSLSFNSPCSFKESKANEQIKVPQKHSRISLSDFLDRKLDKTSILPKTVQGKQRPFSVLVGGGDVAGSGHGRIGVKGRRGGAENDYVLDDSVFEQFKQTRTEKEDYDGSCGGVGVGGSTTNDSQESRKRRNPFEISIGGNEGNTASRHLVVLGDDPKPKQNGREDNFIRNKKPRSLFNHYTNGIGWWDCNMEGVDSEEVGCNEVWEGLGSTTLGGLEWN